MRKFLRKIRWPLAIVLLTGFAKGFLTFINFEEKVVHKMLSLIFGSPWWVWCLESAIFLALFILFEKNQRLSLKDAIVYLEKEHKILEDKDVQDSLKSFEMTPEQWTFNFYLPYMQEYLKGDKILNGKTLKNKFILKKELPFFKIIDENQRTIIKYTTNRFSKNYHKLISESGIVLYENISVKRYFLDKLKLD